jgi:hypothetical protein
MTKTIPLAPAARRARGTKIFRWRLRRTGGYKFPLPFASRTGSKIFLRLLRGAGGQNFPLVGACGAHGAKNLADAPAARRGKNKFLWRLRRAGGQRISDGACGAQGDRNFPLVPPARCLTRWHGRSACLRLNIALNALLMRPNVAPDQMHY